MRVGCGSATIGMFAAQWRGLVDEVVVVDDHITGVVSEHQAGKVLGWADTGIRILGRRSTPGRYFKVSEPGLGWGGTTISDPLQILGPWNPKKGARPGLSLLMVSTTGEQFAYYELDDDLKPVEKPFPERLRKSVDLIEDNCEPALCSVLFMGGAGGSLRAGVTENPVNLTRSVQRLETYVTVGGAPAYVWPGGGITLMVDVARLPDNAFGYVPTPALVAPIEFTMRRDAYVALGGYEAEIRTVEDVLEKGGEYFNDRRVAPAPRGNPFPLLAQLRRARNERPADRLAARRPPPAHESRADRPDRRGVRVGGRATGRLPPGRGALRHHAGGTGGRVAAVAQPSAGTPRAFAGATAKRMEAAACRHADVFVTPMAAVAGAVADEVLAAMVAGRTLERAYVNDGGDIALFLAPGSEMRLAIAGTGHGFADRVTVSGRHAGARRRHQRLAWPLAFAGHRRCGHRAGQRWRRGGCRGDAYRQRGRPARPPGRASCAGSRHRPRQRSGRAAGDAACRAAGTR